MSVADALAQAEKQGRRAACGRGCCDCCRHDVPATPLELAGLRWHVREEMRGETAAALRERVRNKISEPRPACAFLLGGSCAVYAVRPVACRRYMVLGDPCAEGEDVLAFRPHAALAPSRDMLNAAYAETLPYYAALGENIPDAANAFAFMAERTVILAEAAPGILSI